MKFREIFRFEFTYQARRLPTWLFIVVLTTFAFQFVRGSFLADALYQDFYLNAPFIVASVTVFGSLISLLMTATVTGEMAARDAETGMDPLTYTAPVSKADYLGGRFLAAFVLNALMVLAVPAGSLLAVYGPGVDPAIVGPFRPAAYLTAYGFIALPNAFLATAIQFAWATLGRRALASYLGSVLLFFAVYGGMIIVGVFLNREDLVVLLDAFGHVFITSDAVLGWTPIEKNTRLIELEGTLLRSRLLWFSIALGTIAFTYLRFRFAHPTVSSWWARIDLLRATRFGGRARGPAFAKATARQASADAREGDATQSPIAAPSVAPAFNLVTHTRQTLVIAWTSFRTIATSWGGLVVLSAIAAVVVAVLPENMENLGTPLLPRTRHVLTFLTSRLTSPVTPWVIIPLLIVLYAGELVWRERNAGLGEIADAAPVPEWVRILGRFLGLGLILVVWMALLTLAGVLVQIRMSYGEFEIGLYLRVLFGLQLPEYLLFALLALVVQGLVGQKYVGHLVALLAYALILFAPGLGIRHNLLVYGSGPWWSYSGIRGFGSSLVPWLWFKLYWATWALLLAVVAVPLWVRGKDSGFGVRLRLARGRFTYATARAAAVAVAIILGLGGFIFYNTNVLNAYSTSSQTVERRAEYERRYSGYANVPQPRLTATSLHVEIYPERRAVQIRGTYRLVNRGVVAIDSLHLATVPEVKTEAISLDRQALRVLVDDELGHRIYRLDEPLRPGDSLRLSFEVHVEARGFGNGGVDTSVVENGTYFTNQKWLPAIGYQPTRELFLPAQRREQRLPSRPLLPALDDAEARGGWPSREQIDFEAIVGTDGNQTAIAPGVLRRTWTAGPSTTSGHTGRRYFHYATHSPINNEYAFFSGRYALREVTWNSTTSGQSVAIQIFHHPGHAANLDRILRSVQRSLNYYSEQYGPYPHNYVRLIENPARGMGAHAEATTIDYGEGFSLFNPEVDRRRIDLPFAVMAHEMAHQWQIGYAPVEGAGLLTESFAWYSAMGVVEGEYGLEHLRRLLRFFRQPHPIPPIRQSVPLLKGMDPYAAYRKGPFALYALSEYMGDERVKLAFRRLLEKHRPGAANAATSLDLYRELQAVTPDSFRYLLHDLVAANTLWDLKTERATARQTDAGWQVAFDVRARKVVVDQAGVETEVPMNELVQVGVFAPAADGPDFGETLYLQMHRVRSGEQTITVTVPRKPADAGIDPYHLLIETERFDNVEEVDTES
jgi:ABC-type transport system involved in multi-copper enzyme maturation permease subunit